MPNLKNETEVYEPYMLPKEEPTPAEHAVRRARGYLSKGDKVTTSKCPGRKRWFIFSHFDGPWMVSSTGIDDYHPQHVSKVNGCPIDFTKPLDK